MSVDLIYGAPGESLDDWRASLEAAIALAPDHISAYALIIEDGTKLARQIRRGEVAAPDDDLQADMYELADDLLAGGGFDWYEVSNWARDAAQRSRHNLAYWQRLGLVGLRARARTATSGACGSGTSSTPRRTRSGSRRASRPPPDARARMPRPGRSRACCCARGSARGCPSPSCSARAATRSPRSSRTVSSTGPTALRGHVVLTRRGRLLADAVVRALTE